MLVVELMRSLVCFQIWHESIFPFIRTLHLENISTTAGKENLNKSSPLYLLPDLSFKMDELSK